MSNGYKIEKTSIEQYLDSVIEEDIREDHPAQREFCWQKEITDSLLYSAISRKIFIPSFVLVEEIQEDGNKVTYIADALQRTVSLKMFRYQGLKISKKLKKYIVTYEQKKKDDNGHYVRDENGNIIKETVEYDIRDKTYEDLPKELKKNFDSCQLSIATYLDCDREESTDIVFLYNNHMAMNTAQKGHTYAGKFTKDIKRIKNESRFLIDCTYLTEKEKEKGYWERVISETVMAVNHYDKWKKTPKDINSFLNENSSVEEFEKVEDYFNRLIPFSDKMENKKVSELFTSKNLFVWMMLFDRFDKLNIEDVKFGEFLNAFVGGLMNKEVNDENWESIDSARNTKDRKTIDAKLSYLEKLMKEFLGIEEENNTYENDIETEVETDLTEENEETEEISDDEIAVSLENNNGEIDSNDAILNFIKENITNDVIESDIKFYDDLIQESIKITSELYKSCQPALIALTAYACVEDKHVEFDEWLRKYVEKDMKFSQSQKVNYTYLKRDFEKYLEREE